jgi:hypothetical protein
MAESANRSHHSSCAAGWVRRLRLLCRVGPIAACALSAFKAAPGTTRATWAMIAR